jgi:hypothetical protein
MAGQPEGREPAIHFLTALRALDGRLKGGHDMVVVSWPASGA